MEATTHTSTMQRLGVTRNPETWAWLFMRWSGVMLIPLAWIHVLLNDVLIGVHHIDLDYVSLRWAIMGWRVFDAALLAFAFAHGVNGLRQVVDDYVHRPALNRGIKWLMFVVWAAITTIGAIALIGGVRA
jgi:succinate dehydrogenase / fumarate reductase membrane anchor subunit